MRCVAVKGSRPLLVAGLWTLALWALVSRLWTLAGEAASRDPQGMYHKTRKEKPRRRQRAWPRVSGSDSPSLRRVAIFRSMPPPDLTPEEYAEMVRLVRSAIDGERYVLSPGVKRLKNILAKLDPVPSAMVTPYPAPRPSAEPSFLYAKLRGVRRRR